MRAIHCPCGDLTSQTPTLGHPSPPQKGGRQTDRDREVRHKDRARQRQRETKRDRHTERELPVQLWRHNEQRQYKANRQRPRQRRQFRKSCNYLSAPRGCTGSQGPAPLLSSQQHCTVSKRKKGREATMTYITRVHHIQTTVVYQTHSTHTVAV